MKLYTTMARLYDELYQHLFDYDAQAEHANKHFKNGGKILDVSCGSGHLTQRLHQRGYDVKGLDLHEEMLDLAKARATAIDFVVGDMRKLEEENTYDGIVVRGRGFSYMLRNEDVNAALQSFYKALKDGGVLIVDNFDAAQTIARNGRNNVVEKQVGERYIKRTSTSEVELDTCVLWHWDAKYEIGSIQNNDLPMRATQYMQDTSTMRSFFFDEFRLFLQHNGFNVVDVDREKFIFVAQK